MSLEMDRHYGDELQDLLDRRLEREREREIRSHLDRCARCRGEYEALEWVQQAAASVKPADVPAGLESSIRAALAGDERPRVHRRTFLVSAASVLLGTGAGAWLLLRARRTLPAAVMRDYRHVRSGELALQTKATSPVEVEAFFRQNGIGFRTRVLDLAMMRYQLQGGRVHRLEGKPSALFVYQGERGRVLVCQMYPGRLDGLPSADAAHDHRGFRFRVYRQENVTLVFWQEGETVCVLAGDFGEGEVVALAFEKAML